MRNSSIVVLPVLLVLALVSLSCGSGSDLVSISVSPNPATINAPGTLQFKAIGIFNDGTTRALSSANWALVSSVAGVTLSSSGLAYCPVIGGPTAEVGTITASSQGKSGSATLVCTGPGV